MASQKPGIGTKRRKLAKAVSLKKVRTWSPAGPEGYDGAPPEYIEEKIDVDAGADADEEGEGPATRIRNIRTHPIDWFHTFGILTDEQHAAGNRFIALAEGGSALPSIDLARPRVDGARPLAAAEGQALRAAETGKVLKRLEAQIGPAHYQVIEQVCLDRCYLPDIARRHKIGRKRAKRIVQDAFKALVG